MCLSKQEQLPAFSHCEEFPHRALPPPFSRHGEGLDVSGKSDSRARGSYLLIDLRVFPTEICFSSPTNLAKRIMSFQSTSPPPPPRPKTTLSNSFLVSSQVCCCSDFKEAGRQSRNWRNLPDFELQHAIFSLFKFVHLVTSASEERGGEERQECLPHCKEMGLTASSAAERTVPTLSAMCRPLLLRITEPVSSPSQAVFCHLQRQELGVFFKCFRWVLRFQDRVFVTFFFFFFLRRKIKKSAVGLGEFKTAPCLTLRLQH